MQEFVLQQRKVDFLKNKIYRLPRKFTKTSNFQIAGKYFQPNSASINFVNIYDVLLKSINKKQYLCFPRLR